MSVSPGFKAHTPGFADILDAPGETWELGAAPFDTHPEWHIDSTDPAFDDNGETWSMVVRLQDIGSTGYATSEPFAIQFRRGLPIADLEYEIVDVPDATETSLWDITNEGRVIGSYADGGGLKHGFIWENGEVIDSFNVTGKRIHSPSA